MVNKDTNLSATIPDANVRHKTNSISAIWVVPIIAALIGGWLVFKAATEEKAVAEVTFKSASGLEAGKTIVKLRNIKIGGVTDVKFSDDLSKVVVVMEFKGVKQERLTDTTRFWVVRPRVGVGGVSGLSTLISGAYIEVDPGEGGQPVDRFTGLEEPDLYQLGNPGTKYLLRASKLGSLSRGSVIKYRDIDVGAVTRYKLAKDHSNVEIEIFISAPHDKYVKEQTRFWNISGLSVEVGAEGLKLDMASMASLVTGGIAFSTVNDSVTVAQAKEKTAFRLHDSEKVEIEETLAFGAPLKLYFKEGVEGLSVGAAVEFKGIRVGTVTDIAVEVNADKDDILTYAMIDIEPDRLPIENLNSGLNKIQRTKITYQYINTLVTRGLRAQLQSGNLLTGQSVVELDIFPRAKQASLKYIDGVPILPTVPKTLEGVIEQINSLMARIEAMPIEEIGNNIEGIATSVNSLLTSLNAAPIEAIGRNLKETTMSVNNLLTSLNAAPIEAIGRNLEETTMSVNNLAKSLNATEGGMMGVQLRELIEELARAASAIRTMTEYLERHPEALLKGKTAE